MMASAWRSVASSTMAWPASRACRRAPSTSKSWRRAAISACVRISSPRSASVVRSASQGSGPRLGPRRRAQARPPPHLDDVDDVHLAARALGDGAGELDGQKTRLRAVYRHPDRLEGPGGAVSLV